jgi:hypothetical protein
MPQAAEVSSDTARKRSLAGKACHSRNSAAFISSKLVYTVMDLFIMLFVASGLVVCNQDRQSPPRF